MALVTTVVSGETNGTMFPETIQLSTAIKSRILEQKQRKQSREFHEFFAALATFCSK